MTTLVLDLSSNNQRPWNFNEAKAAGIGGVIIKAAESTNYLFDGFRQAFADAKTAGIVRGCYYFARPGSTTPEDAAAYLLAALPPLETGDIVALDIEVDGNGDMSPWALAWCHVVQTALKQVPILYSYPDYITNHLINPALAPYPLWLADLSQTPRASMPPWATVALRQYTWTGHYAGIPGDVDVSSFSGTADDLRTLGKPASVQQVYHVVTPGALKAHPNHGPGEALGVDGSHLHRLEPGTTLYRTAPDVTTAGDLWLPCRLDHPDQVAHGFYPRASCK